jgi:energy-coupling factor transporter ATP-binding protein EcfA2
MIRHQLSFSLPAPWTDKRYEADQIGAINFLVGPNGSGKSRFIGALLPHLPKARLLGTDRLAGMEQRNNLAFLGDHFSSGLQKNWFSQFKSAGMQGSGIDTVVLLEERVDLRIQLVL